MKNVQITPSPPSSTGNPLFIGFHLVFLLVTSKDKDVTRKCFEHMIGEAMRNKAHAISNGIPVHMSHGCVGWLDNLSTYNKELFGISSNNK
eukprot:9530725-Ditylum_brightwellii.AAC.1